MNFDLGPVLISAAAALWTGLAGRRAWRTGSGGWLVVAVLAGALSVVAWFVWWPDAHRTGLLDGLSEIVHDAVHIILVGGAGWVGLKADEHLR